MKTAWLSYVLNALNFLRKIWSCHFNRRTSLLAVYLKALENREKGAFIDRVNGYVLKKNGNTIIFDKIKKE